jgi:peptidoglycan/LPS O-acetylase OafA/YrhL
MESLFAERIYGIPWVALAVVAVLLALAYAVVPGGVDADGWRWIVLRWFHTVAWVFFALAAIARAKVTPAPIEVAAPLAATGGLAYVVLMLAVTAGQS